jgi:hypothetical protein
VGAAHPVERKGVARVHALALILWLLPVSLLPASGVAGQGLAPMSCDSPAQEFVIRFKDGQTKFRQGEIITVELGYGADPQAPAKRFADHPHQPGLAVDRFLLSPHTGVVDPLRDFLSTVGGWGGPPPRPIPFVEAGGPWATAHINEWFRFDNPGKYSLTVLAHAVRNSYEAFGRRPTTANTLKSNTLEFEIVPAEEAWQAATLRKALTLLEAKSTDEPQQGHL